MNGKASLDHVSRGPRNIRDDGFVLFQKGVEQRRFPDVRFPNEGQIDAFTIDAALLAFLDEIAE